MDWWDVLIQIAFMFETFAAMQANKFFSRMAQIDVAPQGLFRAERFEAIWNNLNFIIFVLLIENKIYSSTETSDAKYYSIWLRYFT